MWEVGILSRQLNRWAEFHSETSRESGKKTLTRQDQDKFEKWMVLEREAG